MPPMCIPPPPIPPCPPPIPMAPAVCTGIATSVARAAGSNQRKTTDPLIKLHSVRKSLATFSGYFRLTCMISPSLAEPDFLVETAGPVAHRNAVQRCATASRGATVLNHLQLIRLPSAYLIPSQRMCNAHPQLGCPLERPANGRVRTSAPDNSDAFTPRAVTHFSTGCLLSSPSRTSGFLAMWRFKQIVTYPLGVVGILDRQLINAYRPACHISRRQC